MLTRITSRSYIRAIGILKNIFRALRGSTAVLSKNHPGSPIHQNHEYGSTGSNSVPVNVAGAFCKEGRRDVS
jgi:hypothetical protein